jgi:O-6-methylguanine DNA methyltransferase
LFQDVIYARMESQVGTVWVASTQDGVCKISLGAEQSGAFLSWLSRHLDLARPREEPQLLAGVVSQLHEYFSGSRREFDLPLDVHGTAFQRAVWSQVVRIPYGATATYGGIAQLVGKAKASRAVGAALGANPLPIVVPCHRVIGVGDSLVGFGAGLDVKEALLRLEGAYPF